MKVGEIMTTKFLAVKHDANLKIVMKIMADKNIRSVFVKPKDAGDVPGVIAVRDVVFKVLAKGMNPAQVKASDIVSKPLVCVDKDMKIEYAAMLMDKFNIARVWVKEGKDIIGVVSLLDLVRAALK